MFTIGYCIDDKIIITPDAICPDCGNKVSECTCGEKCLDCGNKISECTCEKCLDCGNKISECTCGEKCLDCGNKISECTCEKCPDCGNKISECTCEKCSVCGEKETECTCEKCLVCGNKVSECTCERCSVCGKLITECTCERCSVCDKIITECTCVRCPKCGKLIENCTCDPDPDPDPDNDRCPVCDKLITKCTCDPEPPYDPDDPEASYHRYTLEVPLSRINLKVKTAQYTNYIGNNVEIEQAIYNEETGTTEIDGWKTSYGPVACPDVTNLYKDYYKYYNDNLATNDDIKIENVDQKYQKIYVDLNYQLEADFSVKPYWKLPELQVKAKTGNEPPYDINDFTFDKSINISETCLNPEAFEEFEPKSMTLNYISIRTSNDTIYITYATSWEKGFGDE